MKGLKFQPPLRALRQGLRTKPVCQFAVPTPSSSLSGTISTGAPRSPSLSPDGDVDNKISGTFFFTWIDKNNSDTWRSACPCSNTSLGTKGEKLGVLMWLQETQVQSLALLLTDH